RLSRQINGRGAEPLVFLEGRGVAPGLPIGRIDSVLVAGGRNDYVLFVEPAAPISTVDYVYVVLRTPDPERAALEAEGS
ncbi:MAG: hypothetical protein AAFR95_18225, partial [Bacteroidota bacterium]